MIASEVYKHCPVLQEAPVSCIGGRAAEGKGQLQIKTQPKDCIHLKNSIHEGKKIGALMACSLFICTQQKKKWKKFFPNLFKPEVYFDILELFEDL